MGLEAEVLDSPLGLSVCKSWMGRWWNGQPRQGQKALWMFCDHPGADGRYSGLPRMLLVRFCCAQGCLDVRLSAGYALIFIALALHLPPRLLAPLHVLTSHHGALTPNMEKRAELGENLGRDWR